MGTFFRFGTLFVTVNSPEVPYRDACLPFRGNDDRVWVPKGMSLARLATHSLSTWTAQSYPGR